MTSKKCSGITKTGARCKRNVLTNDYCILHLPNDSDHEEENPDAEKIKCAGITIKGTRCSKLALEGWIYCKLHLKNHNNEIKEKEKCIGIIQTGDKCTRNAILSSKYCNTHSFETDALNRTNLKMQNDRKMCGALCLNSTPCLYYALSATSYCKIHQNYQNHQIFDGFDKSNPIDWSKVEKIIWPDTSAEYNIHYEPWFQYEQNYKEWIHDQYLQQQKELERQKQEELDRQKQEEFERKKKEKEREDYQKFQNFKRQQQAKAQATQNKMFNDPKLNYKFYYQKQQFQEEILKAILYFDFTTTTINYDQVKSKYRKLVFKLHPDKGGNAEKFKELQKYKDAIDTLYE